MTCSTEKLNIIQSGVKEPEDCKCHGAVMRAYDSLIGNGLPQSIALDAARIVYGYHHPEDTKHNQNLTVERWVNETHLH